MTLPYLGIQFCTIIQSQNILNMVECVTLVTSINVIIIKLIEKWVT